MIAKQPGQLGLRTYATSKFGFELDGLDAGWIWSFEGGMPTTEVVSEKLGPDHLIHKHVSGLKYEDISVSFGSGMSKDFWKWIHDSFTQNYNRRNGALIAADADYKEKTRLTFYDALVNEIAFPALDSQAKDPSKVTVKITPERTRSDVRNKNTAVRGSIDRAKQHLWQNSNFRLRIDGLDTATASVTKIESLVLKQKLTQYSIGEMRDYQMEPVQVEYPNLVVTVPESRSTAFDKWFKTFVVDGKCAEGDEKTGTLEFLTPNLQRTLLQIDFHGLGIFKCTPDKAESTGDKIRMMKYEMYCEKMNFTWKQNSSWG